MKGSRFAGPEDSPGYLLWHATNAWQRAVRSALTPLGLTHVQFVLLACVTWSADGPATQRGLAAMAGIDEMMTSQVARALEHKGLVARTPSITDARARALTATEAGAQLAQEAVTAVEATDAEFFAALGEEEPAFVASLRRLYSGR